MKCLCNLNGNIDTKENGATEELTEKELFDWPTVMFIVENGKMQRDTVSVFTPTCKIGSSQMIVSNNAVVVTKRTFVLILIATEIATRANGEMMNAMVKV